MKQQQLKLGALLWALSLQYYVAQLLVGAAWNGHEAFSWLQNTISDLGNTVCGQYSERYVCSPLHPLMNGSFILLGLTMIGGAWLLSRTTANRLVRLGFGMMIAAGLGTILVGLFPENTVSELHILGAALPFALGNIGMIIIGTKLEQLPAWLRLLSVILGGIALLALALFVAHVDAFLGVGGMERVVAYPQSIWMIVIGLYLLIQARRRVGVI